MLGAYCNPHVDAPIASGARRRRMMKAIACGVCLVLTACDPIPSFGIALTPQPALTEAARESAFALARDVATRHGLRPFVRVDAVEQAWHACFGPTKPSFSICTRATDRDVQFQVYQALTFRLDPLADTVRHELADSLRARFGDAQVRECRWTAHPDHRQAGCPQVASPSGG